MYSGYAFTLAAALMAIGGVGLVLALVGRRSLRRPSCASCGADARGQAWSDAPRCSACNADLRVAGALRLRGRDRSWRWIVAWLVVIGLGGGLWYADRAINEPFGRWDIAVIPTWWDIRQLSSTDVERSETAAWRLVDRVQWNGVTDDELESIVEAILARIEAPQNPELHGGAESLLTVLVRDPRFRQEWLERCRPLFGDVTLSLNSKGDELASRREETLALVACVLIDEIKSGDEFASFHPRRVATPLAPNRVQRRADRFGPGLLGNVEWPDGAPRGDIAIRWRAVYVPAELSRALDLGEHALTESDPTTWGVRSLVLAGTTLLRSDGTPVPTSGRTTVSVVYLSMNVGRDRNAELVARRPWISCGIVGASLVGIAVGLTLRARPDRWARLTVPTCRRCSSALAPSADLDAIRCTECGRASVGRRARFARSPSRSAQRASLVGLSIGVATVLVFCERLVLPYAMWRAIPSSAWPMNAAGNAAFKVALAHGDPAAGFAEEISMDPPVDAHFAGDIAASILAADPLLIVRSEELLSAYDTLREIGALESFHFGGAESPELVEGEEIELLWLDNQLSDLRWNIRGSRHSIATSHGPWLIESVEIGGHAVTPGDGAFEWQWPRDVGAIDVVIHWHARTSRRRSATQVERLRVQLGDEQPSSDRGEPIALTDPAQSPFIEPPTVSLALVGARVLARLQSGYDGAGIDSRIRGTWTVEVNGTSFPLGGVEPLAGLSGDPGWHTVEAIIGPVTPWPPKDIVLVFHPVRPSDDEGRTAYWALEERTTLSRVPTPRWPSQEYSNPRPLVGSYAIWYAPEPNR